MPEERVFPQATKGNSTQDESEPKEEIFEERPSQNETLDIEMKLSRKKALLEFRRRVEDAILGNYIFEPKENVRIRENLRDITIWGVPLLPSKGHEGTDIVLMKFLEAKNYKVYDAFRLLRKTMKWRKEYNVDKILEEKFSPELQSMWCADGNHKEGRPLCYQSFRDFQEKELRKNFLGEHQKLEEFMRWRIQCVEKGIRMLHFSPGWMHSIVHVIDLKNTHRPAMKEIQWFCKKMSTLIYENYPGLIYKTLIVNVPLWFFAIHALNLGNITKSSKNKFIFLRSSKVIKSLLKLIKPENLLVQYGGFKRENDSEFSVNDKVLELNVRGNMVEHIHIPVDEADKTVTWDVAVVGTEVTYKEEFIPNDDCSYKILLHKEKKMERNVRNSFYVREPGNIVITFGNGTFKKKKIFYRYKTKPCVPMYMNTK